MDKLTVVYWLMDEVGPEGASLINIPISEVLSTEEMSRYEQMRFPKRRLDWLRGRVAAKKLLVAAFPHLASCPYNQITIANLPEGAPIAKVEGEVLPVALSLSHRDGYAAAAVSEDKGISLGIDLEVVEDHPESFYQDFFTDGELSLLDHTPENQRALVGSLIWSAKEAVLKALGKGLRLDTRTVEIATFDRSADDGWGSFSLRIVNNTDNHWYGYWREERGHLIVMAAGGTKDRPILIPVGK